MRNKLKQLINTSSSWTVSLFWIRTEFPAPGGLNRPAVPEIKFIGQPLGTVTGRRLPPLVGLSRGKYYVRIIPADCGTYIAYHRHSNYYQAFTPAAAVSDGPGGSDFHLL